MSGRDIMTRPLWELLGARGGRSIVVNVPTTYPPEPLNGEMITGMLTPGLDSEFTYPAALKRELIHAIPDYIIEPARAPDKHARMAEFNLATHSHERATEFLMKRGEWDFLMVVFSVLDRAQHDFWADMDPSHPRHDKASPPEFREFIFKTYEGLDSAIERLIEKLPADVRVLIVSDHGFCSELFEVRVNELLARAGLLAFKTPASRRARAQLKSVKEKISRRIRPERVNGNSLERKVHYGSAFLEEIDWSRTRAYFAQDKGVWVNLEGRESAGVVGESRFEDTVEEARELLLNLLSPESGETVFEAVLSREEAFNGIFSDRLPDLVMIPRNDSYVYNERPSYGDVIVPADSTTGTHSRDGIFIAWGRGIGSGVKFTSQPNLRDIAPTALASLGTPLTEDMDSRVLAEIFSEKIEQVKQGSSYREPANNADAAGQVYSETEETELRERLRALGYIE